MYVEQAAADLVGTLAAMTTPASSVILAHGRNRQAEAQFLVAAAAEFVIESVPPDSLDSVLQCSDVFVWFLRRSIIPDFELVEFIS